MKSDKLKFFKKDLKNALWQNSRVSVDDMTFAMRHDFLMEEAYGTFEDFLVRNDFIYEIAHAWFPLMDVCGTVGTFLVQ